MHRWHCLNSEVWKTGHCRHARRVGFFRVAVCPDFSFGLLELAVSSFFQLSSQPYRRLERRFGPAAKPQNHYRMGQNPEFWGSFFRQKFCGSFIFWTFAILLHPLLSLVCHHYLVWNSNERILICVDSEALRSCVLPSVAKGTQLSLPNESNNTI